MPNNYVLLDRIELNADTASVTFDNIPQTGYTDLKLVMSARVTGTGTAANIAINFNGSATSFVTTYLGGGNGTAAPASSTISGTDGPLLIWTAAFNDSTANVFGNTDIYIPNYTSNTFKSVSTDGTSENNAADGRKAFNATLWSNTAAITSIRLAPQSGSFMRYSTFSLYGIAKLGTTPAIAPKANGGNVIETDGTYWYHTFLASGTFTPQVGLTCDYLVIAGGGAGGNGNGGAAGGGAGGFLTSVGSSGGGGSAGSPLSLTPINYAVTVGAGGVGGVGSSGVGTNGSNSVFSSVTAIGGGLGGSYGGTQAGSVGGSGGGSIGVGGTVAGGAGTTGQGYAGGSGTTNEATYRSAGGGGGAGAVGVNGPTNNSSGAGGAGLANSITGTSVTRAGGGGGSQGTAGAGGTGGGGAGGATGTAGTVNTGSGGGGGTWGGSGGGNGGSGIVIIRYPVAS